MKACCTLLFLLISWSALAQLEQSKRLEFKVSQTTDEYFDVTPLNENGVLITKRQEEHYGNEKWEFFKFDTTLKETWKTSYRLPNELRPLKSFHNINYLFWLLIEPDTDNISVLRVDLHTGDIEVFKGDMLTKADIVHFKVLDNTAFLGGYHNNRPVVLAFSFFDKSVKALPYLYTANSEINNIELDEQRNQLHVLIYTFKRGNCQFTLKTYSYQGKLIKTTTMPFENDNGLISGKIVPLDEHSSLLVGNYAQGCTQYSQGLYFSKIKDNEPEKLQWIDFSKLENFFNYLNPKRKQRVVEKISKQKTEGKEPKFRYRLLVHDIIKHQQGYILVAEIYYPVYKNGSIYPNGFRNVDKDFDGFRYTHAIVCGFDQAGHLLWDNCVGLNNLENSELQKIVQLTQQDDLLILAYPKEGKIHTEVIERNKVVRETEIHNIKTANESDRVITNDDNRVASWYNRYFLAYGYQKISSEKVIGLPREIFYINKLSYDPTKPYIDPKAESKNKKLPEEK